MTSKERVLKTLRFEKTDRAPVAVLNGQMWIAARHGLTMASLLELPDAGAQLLVDAYREIGTEIMTSGCAAAWPMMEVMGGRVDMNALSAEILTHPLSSLEDIDRFDVGKVIADMREEHYYQRTLVQMREMRRLVGDEYMIGGGFFGPFTMAAQMLGVEDFMVELLTGEEEDVKKVIDFAAEIVIAYLEDLTDNGLDLITVPEPAASGDLIRPADFENFVLPADIKVMERLAPKCRNYLIHICGKTDKLVATIAGTGMSVFSVDSINMVRAQQDSAGRCALFGNLSPAHILASKSADEVYAISKSLCESMKPYGGFILAPGCDLAPNIPLENLQAMARAARES
ncbi:MAG: hypothetical protein J6V24_09365 [Clostridia bacterium]|nr:hypothetical protein [Clostridia bacterium]